MRRKLIMRKWVEYTLLGVLFIAIIVGMSDSTNETIFLISHTIDLIVIIIIGLIFAIYGRESN